MASLFDQRPLGESARFEPGDESRVPYSSRLQVHGTGNERDTSMVQRKKMLQSLMNALAVVDTNICAVGAGFAGIHEYRGNVSTCQLCDQRRVRFRSHNCYAVYLAFNHAPYASRHPLRIVIRVSDDDLLAPLNRLVFKAFDQFGEKRVGYVRDDQSQHATSSRYQGASV